MKNFLKHFRIIVLTVIIGFSIIGCEEDSSNNSNNGNNTSGTDANNYYTSGAELIGTAWRNTHQWMGRYRTITYTITSATAFNVLTTWSDSTPNDGPYFGTFTLSGNNITFTTAQTQTGTFTSKSTFIHTGLQEVFTRQ